MAVQASKQDMGQAPCRAAKYGCHAAGRALSGGGLHGNKLVPAGRALRIGLGPEAGLQQDGHVKPAGSERG